MCEVRVCCWQNQQWIWSLGSQSQILSSNLSIHTNGLGNWLKMQILSLHSQRFCFGRFGVLSKNFFFFVFVDSQVPRVEILIHLWSWPSSVQGSSLDYVWLMPSSHFPLFLTSPSHRFTLVFLIYVLRYVCILVKSIGCFLCTCAFNFHKLCCATDLFFFNFLSTTLRFIHVAMYI